MACIYLVIITFFLLNVFSLGTLAMASGFGAGIMEIGCCIGPCLATLRYRGIPVKVRLLPLGSYVKLKQHITPEMSPTEEDYVLLSETPGLYFDELNWTRRICISLGGPLLLIGISIVCIGVTPALDYGGAIFREIRDIIVSPASAGKLVISSACEHLNLNAFNSIGPIAVKLGILNLLPIPLLNGWHILWTLVFREREQGKIVEKLQLFSLFFIVFVWFRIFSSIYYFLT